MRATSSPVADSTPRPRDLHEGRKRTGNPDDRLTITPKIVLNPKMAPLVTKVRFLLEAGRSEEAVRGVLSKRFAPDVVDAILSGAVELGQPQRRLADLGSISTPVRVLRSPRGYHITGYRGDPELGRRHRVTDIIGRLPNPALDRWRQRIGERQARAIRDRGARRGAAVHDAIESRLRGKPQPIQPDLFEADAMADRALAWLHSEGWTPVEIEMTMWSARLPLAGTVDLWAKRADGRMALIDWKTSRRVYETHAIQLATYRGLDRALLRRSGDADAAGAKGDGIEWLPQYADDLIVVHVSPSAATPYRIRAGALPALQEAGRTAWEILSRGPAVGSGILMDLSHMRLWTK